jgi:hypothetical protein
MSGPYRDRYGGQRPGAGEVVEPLLPVKLMDPDLHRRLLAAVRDLDQACADQCPERIPKAGEALAAEWRCVAEAMEKGKGVGS